MALASSYIKECGGSGISERMLIKQGMVNLERVMNDGSRPQDAVLLLKGSQKGLFKERISDEEAVVVARALLTRKGLQLVRCPHTRCEQHFRVFSRASFRRSCLT